MDPSAEQRRLTGALRFLADLNTVAAECAAGGVPSDELTARRRLRRLDARIAVRAEAKRVKAL